MTEFGILSRKSTGLAAVVVLFALGPAVAQGPAPLTMSSTVVATPAPAAPVPAAIPAQPPAVKPSPGACTVPGDYARFELPLPRVTRRLVAGRPITIVALGSSSTAGAGATSPDASYPSQLAVELGKHFPGHEFKVINRGVNGEEARDMLARFETSVIAAKPDLVLWQAGTNSLLRDHPLQPHLSMLRGGIAQLKSIATDIVLIDPQFAPRVIAKANADAMVALIAAIAKSEKVDLFRRFALMRHWREVERLPFDAFLSRDELHMNDWSYACVARALGMAIAEAVNRPTETAAMPRAQ